MAVALRRVCDRIRCRSRESLARAAVDANLSLLSPEQDARVLSEAGFRDVEMFYAAFTWRGWVGYA